MGHDLLSREELALLLADGDDASAAAGTEAGDPFSPGDFGLLATAIDRILMEGGQAWSLSLGAPVEFLPCQVALVSPAMLASLGPTAVGELAFSGQMSAHGYLVLPMGLALEVSRRALGQVEPRAVLDETGRKGLTEAVNLLVAELRAQVHRISERKVATSAPRIYLCESQQGPEHQQLVEARATVTIGGRPQGDLLFWAELPLAHLLAGSAQRPVLVQGEAPDGATGVPLSPGAVVGSDDAAAPPPEQGPPAAPPAGQRPEAAARNATPAATLRPIAGVARSSRQANATARVDADEPHLLSVEVGRVIVTESQRASITLGTVLPLDRLAGESVDVLIDGEVVARGEVVVIDETIGVKITKLEVPREPEHRANTVRGPRGDAQGFR